MSASLVGSEMCIRDRPTTARSVQSLVAEATDLARKLFGTWGQTKVIEDLFQALRDREDRQGGQTLGLRS
eukprot:5601496-Alexandrium_andersonii.AAC.1